MIQCDAIDTLATVRPGLKQGMAHAQPANGGEIEIRERSDLDRARRIAYILSQAATTKS